MKLWTKIQIMLTRVAVLTLGQSSEGIRLVTTKGLTSGVMLDYIYQNQPNLVDYLLDAISIQRKLKRQPIVVDIAAGSARYILDVKSKGGMDDVIVICRDLDEEALEQGKRNAEKLDISGIHFGTGDAPSAESLALVEPKANIAVSSGFYDWVNEDEVVQKSMALLYQILPSGGCFLFTNQARHVNQEFVQGVFKNLYGQPLRMTMRSAVQMNSWAESAGFTIIKTTGDVKFNYSVTLSQKP